MMKKRLLKGLVAASLVVSLAAGSVVMAEESSGESLKIAYSIPEMFSTFWAACIKGFEDQCAEYGYEAVTLDPNGDTELQMSQLINQATTGADAIVISRLRKIQLARRSIRLMNRESRYSVLIEKAPVMLFPC